MFLADQLKPRQRLVTPYKYSSIAYANAQVGNYALATKYAERAIKVCPNKDTYNKARVTDMYGQILFGQDIEKGRAQFNSALSLLQELDNQGYILAVDCCRVWAELERDYAPEEQKADELYKRAEDAFNKISNPIMQKQAVDALQKIRATPL
jgi:hypothetical protein